MNSGRRAGDKGMTTLPGSGMVSKADERIMLLGELEELGCFLEIMRADAVCSHLNGVLERILRALDQVSESVCTKFSRKLMPEPEELQFLEQEIRWLDTQSEAMWDAGSSEYPETVRNPEIPGTRETAIFRMAASIVRRTERALVAVDRRYGVRAEARQYMNRLSDYFESAARYQAALAVRRHTAEEQAADTLCMVHQNTQIAEDERKLYGEAQMAENKEMTQQQIVQQVLGELGKAAEVTLEQAKKLIEATEAEALRRGLKAVISVCNSHGNPVAVHVMDGAFLVSFDVALKKAYTAAAVRMPTMELAKLAAPGGTFYGVDGMDGGRITIIGGGIPLIRGGVLCGAIGVSGGTGEEDHGLASYAVDIFARM